MFRRKPCYSTVSRRRDPILAWQTDRPRYALPISRLRQPVMYPLLYAVLKTLIISASILLSFTSTHLRNGAHILLIEMARHTVIIVIPSSFRWKRTMAPQRRSRRIQNAQIALQAAICDRWLGLHISTALLGGAQTPSFILPVVHDHGSGGVGAEEAQLTEPPG